MIQIFRHYYHGPKNDNARKHLVSQSETGFVSLRCGWKQNEEAEARWKEAAVVEVAVSSSSEQNRHLDKIGPINQNYLAGERSCAHRAYRRSTRRSTCPSYLTFLDSLGNARIARGEGGRALFLSDNCHKWSKGV